MAINRDFILGYGAGKASKTNQTIIEETDAWLEENISQETGYVLDRTLTLENAAAPADLVGDLKSAFDDLVIITPGDLVPTATSEHKIMSTSGSSVVFYDNDSYLTGFIPVTAGDYYIIANKNSGFNRVRHAIADGNKNVSYLSYASTDIYPNNPLKVTIASNGFIVISVLNDDYLKTAICTTPEYKETTKEISNDYSLNNTQKSEVFDLVSEKLSNIFNGKKIGVVGDSITYGYYASSSDGNGGWNGGQLDTKWYEMFINDFLANQNPFVSADIGRAYTRNGSMSTRFTQAIKSIENDCDIIFVFGGTNDFGFAPPLGSIDDLPSDSDGGITFYSAVKYVAEYLTVNYTDAIIIFITPLPRNDGETFNPINSAHCHLSDYAKAIKEVASIYGCFCIDLNCNISGFYVASDEWKAENMLDGLHPNDSGTNIYYNNGIKPQLLSQYGCLL